MNIQEVTNIVVKTGLTANIPVAEKCSEHFILTIEADHNDADYRTQQTKFKVDKNFDLVELLNVLKVLRKLQQSDCFHGDDTWHIAPMYHKLSEEDVRILFEYESKRSDDVNSLDEYTLLDKSDDECADGDIPWWFPCVEFNREGEDINGNHSLISIKLQYNDGNGNLLNIEL